ncbi:hypothetical protein FOL47_000824 [Perkinsus chesapeaki]|uniref:Uncharacterized protein n=1 Tax=Perkinsus chesapeaki TaxID=330153 RepID=A0A7J6MKU3_PERCH|nr:hypothetical protein FOL47_000824 [Perkinsus chesapeaki]
MNVTLPIPKLNNTFLQDEYLQRNLRRIFGDARYSEVESDLIRFGGDCAGPILEAGRQCELHPPYHRPYDAWGNRVDEIWTCPEWKGMHGIAAKEGLIALAYSRPLGREISRLYQLAKLYLFAPSSGLYSCPLAMTDGAAFVIEKVLQKAGVDGRLKRELEEAFSHLTSQNPDEFWTSGQWMTERGGGSDVSAATATTAAAAVKDTGQEDEVWLLSGNKWFTSATDAHMTFTLARTPDTNGKVDMFYLKTRDQQGKLNGLEVVRLKDKLGTRQLPTAEMNLVNSQAMRVTEDGKGVGMIMNLASITRIHNTISASSGMRRILQLAVDYSTKREAFGRKLMELPAHVAALAELEVEARASCSLWLEMGRLLGKVEAGTASDDEALVFRLLVPLSKLQTGRQGVDVASKGIELFGGAGYMEDTGLPAHLRDAQVLAIWEGTSNVQALDVLRVIAQTNGAALAALRRRFSDSRVISLIAPAEQLLCDEFPEPLALRAAVLLGRAVSGGLMLEHASYLGSTACKSDMLAATRWLEGSSGSGAQVHMDNIMLVYGGSNTCLSFNRMSRPEGVSAL